MKHYISLARGGRGGILIGIKVGFTEYIIFVRYFKLSASSPGAIWLVSLNIRNVLTLLSINLMLRAQSSK